MNTMPCPICSVRPGACLKMCNAGIVDVNKIARQLHAETIAEARAETGMIVRPSFNEPYWNGVARDYLETLGNIWSSKK